VCDLLQPPGAAAEAAAWIADAHARWGQVVRASGMRLG
jgi:hypothetical protein